MLSKKEGSSVRSSFYNWWGLEAERPDFIDSDRALDLLVLRPELLEEAFLLVSLYIVGISANR